MKSKRKDKNIDGPRPFPKLMQGKHTKNVYLMFNSTQGVVMFPGDEFYPVGVQRKDFEPNCLEDYDGEITLSNE